MDNIHVIGEFTNCHKWIEPPLRYEHQPASPLRTMMMGSNRTIGDPEIAERGVDRVADHVVFE